MLLAIDQGTTSSRSLLLDVKGRILSSFQLEHRQVSAKPGWVEHDANEIWKNVETTIYKVLELAKISADKLKAIAITNQRETCLVWNKQTGIPVANAIVWQDLRTSDYCSKLREFVDLRELRKKTGLPLEPYFSASKLAWMIDQYQLSTRSDYQDLVFGTIDSWLIYKLSGEHCTDHTNASRTLLFDINKLAWDPDLCEIFKIPEFMLPRVEASIGGNFGNAKIAGTSIPIAAVLGDQHAALYGQKCFEPGAVKITYGTGCFLLCNIGPKAIISEKLICTPAWTKADGSISYALEGSIAVAGSLMQWLRDQLQLFKSSKEIDQFAAQVNDTGDLYIVPAFSGLYAPYWRSDARGLMIGITRYTDKRHIARAALEAIAYQVKDVLLEFDRSGVKLSDVYKVDGGMVHSAPLMQIQADLLNAQILIPEFTEATALGAAFAAGLAVGFWSSEAEIANLLNDATSYSSKLVDYTKKYSRWQAAVQRSFAWVDT